MVVDKLNWQNNKHMQAMTAAAISALTATTTLAG